MDVPVESGLWAAGIAPTQDGHGVPTPYKPLEISRRHTLCSPTQVEDVGEVDGVTASDESARHETRRAQDHREAIKMRFVDESQNALLEFAKRRLDDGFFELLCLEV